MLKTASAVRVAATNLLPKNSGGGAVNRPPTRWAVADQDAVVREVVWHHRGRRSITSTAQPLTNRGDDDTNSKENNVEDDDDAADHVLAAFSYIVTRPTAFLKDGPSVKKVSASKSVRSLARRNYWKHCNVAKLTPSCCRAATRSLSTCSR